MEGTSEEVGQHHARKVVGCGSLKTEELYSSNLTAILDCICVVCPAVLIRLKNNKVHKWTFTLSFLCVYYNIIQGTGLTLWLRLISLSPVEH